MGDIRLFVSHAHAEPDREIARSLVDLIETAMVREGRILCTSHPKREYREPPNVDVSEYLREHLREAACVVAVLTPHSLNSYWCLFELGGAWARATKTYPLLAGGVTEENLPPPLQGKLCGQLGDPQNVRRLLVNLRTQLGWDERDMKSATRRIDELVSLVHRGRWPSLRLGQANVPSHATNRLHGSGPVMATAAILGLLAAVLLVRTQGARKSGGQSSGRLRGEPAASHS